MEKLFLRIAYDRTIEIMNLINIVVIGTFIFSIVVKEQ